MSKAEPTDVVVKIEAEAPVRIKAEYGKTPQHDPTAKEATPHQAPDGATGPTTAKPASGANFTLGLQLCWVKCADSPTSDLCSLPPP